MHTIRSFCSPAIRSFHRRQALGLAVAVLLLSVAVGTAAARAWLGVSVQDLTPSLREALEFPTVSGALVNDVVPDSPADEAGIEPQDLILRLDNRPVEDADDLVEHVRDLAPGDRVRLTLLRRGEEIDVETVLTERREAPAFRTPRFRGRDHDRLGDRILKPLRQGPRLGVHVISMDRDLASYFDAKAGEGLLVLQVDDGSPADQADVRAGDLLLRFNGEPIQSGEGLRSAIGRLDPGDRWSIEGRRKGKEILFQGEIEEETDWPAIEELKDWFSDEESSNRTDWAKRQVERLKREVERLRREIRNLERQIDR